MREREEGLGDDVTDDTKSDDEDGEELNKTSGGGRGTEEESERGPEVVGGTRILFH